MTRVSAVAVRVYYRASRSGRPVPASGPVLMVGNHPNSLLDPAFVAWAAQRPVRFLAKEPLFRDPFVGWLVRGSGSLPVYREQDHPGQTARNADTFRAVHAALGGGAVVAIFPEGISHSLPSLAPLKTGAARLALGAAPAAGGAFPIIPVGLVFRAKDTFRSEAHVVVGAPIAWDDLAGGAVQAELAGTEPADQAAVAALTARIEEGMRAVTLNLAQWEDDEVVRTAEGIWATWCDADSSPGAQVARLALTSRTLAVLRASGNPAWAQLATDVRRHARLLAAIRFTPADVQRGAARSNVGLRRIVRAFPSAALHVAVLVPAILLCWVPYRLTGIIATRMSPSRDTLSTYKVMVGAAVFSVWILGLALLATALASWLWGAIVCAGVPLLALRGLRAAEQWGQFVETARQWRLSRSDPRLMHLRERQADLAKRLDSALQVARAGAWPG
jgi:glycerol-3-phosphate O-acyltransferase/dihydroxyacetone phosphate acyltransferase